MAFRDVASAVAQATPPVYVTGAQLRGIPVDDWIKYGTLLYLACQFVVIAPKLWGSINRMYRRITNKGE